MLIVGQMGGSFTAQLRQFGRKLRKRSTNLGGVTMFTQRLDLNHMLDQRIDTKHGRKTFDLV
jgi:hypothetical protein